MGRRAFCCSLGIYGLLLTGAEMAFSAGADGRQRTPERNREVSDPSVASSEAWHDAEQALQRYIKAQGIAVKAIEPEWFARQLPEGRLYRVVNADAGRPHGPLLLKWDGTIQSLAQGEEPLFALIKTSNVIFASDADAKAFIQMLWKVLYGETGRLLQIQKVDEEERIPGAEVEGEEWQFEWEAGQRRGLVTIHLDEHKRIINLYTPAS